MLFVNHQSWKIQLTNKGNSFSLKLIDPWGFSYLSSAVIIENVPMVLNEQLTNCSLIERPKILYDYIQLQLGQHNKHKIHVEKINRNYILRFGQYGLLGGGREGSLFFSAAQTTLGVVLIASGGGSILGSILLSSGISGGMTALNSSEEDFNEDEYLKQTVIGGTVGAISGGVFSALGPTSTAVAASSSESILLAQTVAGSAGKVSHHILNDVAHGKDLPSAKELAWDACVGGVTAGAASVTSGVSQSLTSKIFKGMAEGADDIALAITNDAVSEVTDDILIAAVEGASRAVAGNVASTIAGNAMEKRDINSGLKLAIAQGAILGGAIGGLQTAKNNTDKGLDDPEEPPSRGPNLKVGQKFQSNKIPAITNQQMIASVGKWHSFFPQRKIERISVIGSHRASSRIV